MHDDWRLRIEVDDADHASEIAELLRGHEVQRDLEHSFQDQVVVSVDGPDVFCYADSREQAQRAEQTIQTLGAERGWTLAIELSHWHPTAETWEDADEPLPQSEAELAGERHERVLAEREGSAAQGYPDFEVRVQCAGHGDASALADRLHQEGIPIVRRWSYVLIGAPDEDSAEALAQRLRSEAPAGSQVTVESNLRALYDARPWRPFSVLGGLAG